MEEHSRKLEAVVCEFWMIWKNTPDDPLDQKSSQFRILREKVRAHITVPLCIASGRELSHEFAACLVAAADLRKDPDPDIELFPDSGSHPLESKSCSEEALRR